MGLQFFNPRLVWVNIVEGGTPAFFEAVFQGTPDEAAAHLQSRADQQGFAFGQVIDAHGLVLSNIAPNTTRIAA